MFKIILATALASTATYQAAYCQAVRWVQTKTAVSPVGRYQAAMVFDEARGQVVLFGGSRAGKALGDTWTLEGNVWTLKKPNRSPVAHGHPVMSYDQARQEVVLFSRLLLSSQSDTWIWDGSTWKMRPTMSAPSSPQDRAMAYDAARQRTVLFGGTNSETWEWDGQNWKQIKPTSSPSVRSGHAMVYDAIRKRIVLFGGYAQGKTFVDTWTWDGKTWTRMSPTVSPPARRAYAMSYDEDRQAVVLFGGYTPSGSSLVSDTWTWDGKTWTQLVFQSRPQGRSHHSMVYDAKRHETVLFGGVAGQTSLSDTWKLVTYTAASSTLYGTGCGTFPGVRLASARGSLPVLGSNFTIEVLGLPSPATAGLLTLGVSKSKFGPVTLPFNLGPVGMKGCSLYNSFDIQFVFLIRQGVGSYSLPVPYSWPLKKSKVFLQAFGADRAANSFGIVSSNGLEVVIGYR